MGPIQGQTYTVEEGDSLPSIAAQHGYRSWETIWYHDQNSSLRDLGRNPGVLNPGDILFLPPLEYRDFQIETDKKHTFRVKALRCYLELVLEDEEKKPYANSPFKLVIDGSKTITGTTDADGYFKEAIPPKSQKAKITIMPADGRPKQEYALALGYMDPSDTNTGIQAILNNLGYDAGENDGTIDDQFRGAILAFQIDNDLEATGELDDATRAILQS